MVLFDWRIALQPKPIRYAYLETTNYCNLRCSFCNREDVIGKLQHMPIEKWEIMLNKLADHPIQEAKLMSFLEEFKKVDRKICKVTVNYVVNTNNIDDIQKVYDEIVIPYGLEELRLNIAQDWSEDSSITNTVGGYSPEQIQYLKDNWKDHIKGKSQWDYSDCFWPQDGLYTTVEGRVLMCALNTGAREFGNLFYEDIDEIRNKKEYLAVKDGCSSNNPTSHCKNCSYKELAPMLAELGVHNDD